MATSIVPQPEPTEKPAIIIYDENAKEVGRHAIFPSSSDRNVINLIRFTTGDDGSPSRIHPPLVFVMTSSTNRDATVAEEGGVATISFDSKGIPWLAGPSPESEMNLEFETYRAGIRTKVQGILPLDMARTFFIGNVSFVIKYLKKSELETKENDEDTGDTSSDLNLTNNGDSAADTVVVHETAKQEEDGYLPQDSSSRGESKSPPKNSKFFTETSKSGVITAVAGTQDSDYDGTDNASSTDDDDEDLDEPVKPRGRGYAEGSPELGTAADLVDPVDPVDPVGPSAEPNFNTQERDSEDEAAAPLGTAALRALKNKGKELEDLLTESETEEELSPLKSKGKAKDKGKKVASAMKEGSDSLPEDFQVQTKKSPKATYSRRTRKQTVEETPQPQGTKRHRLDSDVEHEEDAPRRAKKRVRNDQDESFSTAPEAPPSKGKPAGSDTLAKPALSKNSTKSKSKTSATASEAAGNTQYSFDASSDGDTDEESRARKTPASRAAKTPRTGSTTKSTKSRSSTARNRTTSAQSSASPSPPGFKPRIIFSKSSFDGSKAMAQFIRSQHGQLSSQISHANILVVSTSELTRTPKLVIAVAKGMRIVTDNWLKDSKKAAKFLDPADEAYSPLHEASEKQWGRTIAEALQAADEGGNKVLDGYTVYLTHPLQKQLTKNNQRDDMMAMIEAAGASQVRERPPLYHESPEDEERAKAILLATGVQDKDAKDVIQQTGGKWEGYIFKAGLVGGSVMKGKLGTAEKEWQVGFKKKTENGRSKSR